MEPSPSSSPRRRMSASLIGLSLLAAPTIDALAADLAPTVTVGAGARTSFTSTDVDGSTDNVNDFKLDNARIYLNGKITDSIGFMFNTEYMNDDFDVLDAAAQFTFSDQFHVWAGRFLPPSDRANLYGPYYASHWGVYQDGVQDGYPFNVSGRADGVMYWGQFGKAKLSAGAFDVPSTLGSKDVLYAGRLQFDLWDLESGYYLNGSYYGAKDLLGIGIAAQTSDGDNAFTVDLLMEKKLGGGGVLTLEAEYAKYDGLGGYGIAPESDGYYVLGAYLFPQVVGIGKFQVLAKFGTSTHDVPGTDIDWDTMELNLNYIIKDQAARVHLFYIDRDYSRTLPDVRQIGLGLQFQM